MRRDTPLAPSISTGPLCPPAGDKGQVRPVCLDKVCFSSTGLGSRGAAWNPSGQSPICPRRASMGFIN